MLRKVWIQVNPVVLHRVVQDPSSQFDDVALETLRDMLSMQNLNYYRIDATFSDERGGDHVCLTFDDGFASDREIVLPLLLEFGAVATFFVVTDWIGRPGFLTEHMIRELHEAGMQIGSHSRTHPNFLRLDSDTVNLELVGSRQRLEDVIGEEVAAFSFPYGYENSDLINAVFTAGYSYCCTSRHGLWRDASPVIPRNSINGTMSKQDVRHILEAKSLTRIKWTIEDMGKSGVKRYFPNSYYKIRSIFLRK